MKSSQVSLRCSLVIASFVAGSLVASAATPWQKVSLFKRIESDPNKDYPLTDAQGPWMIMAATFSGDDAERQAADLVHEFRSAYKLPAYTHKMDFDFRGGTVGRGIDQYGAPLRMQYRRSRTTEIAVLVGDYVSLTDPDAQKTLKRLKYLHPQSMDFERLTKQGGKAAPPLASWRWVLQSVPDAARDKKGTLAEFVNPALKEMGPMSHAFITSNPLLPDEYFRPKGIDKLVYELNKPLKYSLLTCKGRYTVKVATFNGRMVTDQSEIKAIESGKRFDSGLEEAAAKAHRLTELLRGKGYEAFEFHDRYSSMVTVGSFDSVGSPRADGKIEINPQIHQIMNTFGAEKATAGGKATAVGKPKTLDGIALDVQPLPVEVPQHNVIVDYDRSMVGMR
jgi:hypothetical protein